MSIKVLNRPAVLIGNRGSLISQTFTSNGTYNASDYSADGFNVVNVSVAGGGGNDNELKLLTGRIGDYIVPQEIGSMSNLNTGAFYFKRGLRSIDLNNVQVIPAAAFSGCSGLTEVVGNKVEFISGYSDFNSCVNLKSVSFPELKLYIGGAAFEGCRQIESLDFPKLAYVSGGSLVWGNSATISSISFPECVCINGNVFGAYNRNITSLATPKLTTIMMSTFYGLSLIEKFDTDNLFSMIGSANFYGCRSLKSIYLKAVPSVQQTNFSGCSSLSEASLGGVIRLEGSVFFGCTSLQSAFFPFCVYVGPHCFASCSSLSQVFLGNASISNSAFFNCTSLESLYMLTCQVPTLFNNAFSNTPMQSDSYLGHFGSIYVPSSLVASFKAATNWASLSDRITALPSEYDSKFIYAYEFYNRTDLTSFPSEKLNAEYICNNAFYSCYNISGEAYFSKAKEIGHSAFYTCRSLTSLNFPECNLAGSQAFYSCNGLESMSFPELVVALTSAFYNNSISHLEFPKLEFIGSGCFEIMKQLNSISVPNVKYIDREAFMNCYSLQSVSLPNLLYFSNGIFSQTSVSYFRYDGVTMPGLAWARSLSEIYAPNVIAITGNGFENCNALSKVTFSTLYFLPYNCFRSCANLKEINIDKVSGELPTSCFYGCTTLKKIRNFYASYITASCFASCFSMSKALFATYYIYSSAFANCRSLSKLYLMATAMVSLQNSNAFSSTPIANSGYLSGAYGSIYVPSYLVSDYQNDSMWSWFADRFVGLTDEEFQDVIDHWYDAEPNE